MSKHAIHNMTVEVTVSQGELTEQARGRCIGKVVNICRDMSPDEFQGAMQDMQSSLQGTARSAALLGKIDEALAENYTPRYSDDLPPVASIELSE